MFWSDHRPSPASSVFSARHVSRFDTRFRREFFITYPRQLRCAWHFPPTLCRASVASPDPSSPPHFGGSGPGLASGVDSRIRRAAPGGPSPFSRAIRRPEPRLERPERPGPGHVPTGSEDGTVATAVTDRVPGRTRLVGVPNGPRGVSRRPDRRGTADRAGLARPDSARTGPGLSGLGWAGSTRSRPHRTHRIGWPAVGRIPAPRAVSCRVNDVLPP